MHTTDNGPFIHSGAYLLELASTSMAFCTFCYGFMNDYADLCEVARSVFDASGEFVLEAKKGPQKSEVS